MNAKHAFKINELLFIKCKALAISKKKYYGNWSAICHLQLNEYHKALHVLNTEIENQEIEHGVGLSAVPRSVLFR